MRKKRLMLNTLSSLVLQIVTIVCGFILPKMILSTFGSEVNGLINSISQFLQIFTFMDIGVGAVFQSSLYKPLAENNIDEISGIYSSGQKFFNMLAKMLSIYIFILIILYPLIINRDFNFLYSSLLILVISVSYFAQYYFGITNSLLLSADQRGYIQFNIQIVTLILNTICCYVLIKTGASIHVVKLATSIIYLLRPYILKIYVEKHYTINKKIKYNSEPIKQKWEGLGQHVASVVLDSTDTIVLTIFSSLSNVSIYSVYYLVISGLKQLFNISTNGIQSLIGDLYARDEKLKLRNVFEYTEWIIHSTTVIIFGCCSILLLQFIMLYTNGVNDANYYQPIFAYILVLAYATYCIRLPYHIAIKAAVHYKQTKNCYWIAALLNVLLSILFVKKFGLVGVAIGTLMAMVYQTIWMAIYLSRNIIFSPLNNFLLQVFVDLIVIFLSFLISKIVVTPIDTYKMWIINGVVVFFIRITISYIINYFFYRDRMKKIRYIFKKNKTTRMLIGEK